MPRRKSEAGGNGQLPVKQTIVNLLHIWLKVTYRFCSLKSIQNILVVIVQMRAGLWLGMKNTEITLHGKGLW